MLAGFTMNDYETKEAMNLQIIKVQIEFIHRSSGDTLTRENFYKLKAKIAEARLLTMQRSPSDKSLTDEGGSTKGEQNSKDSLAPPGSENPAQAGDEQDSKVARPLSTAANAAAKSCDGIVRAIRSRIQSIRAGELLSIMFIRYCFNLGFGTI